MDSENREIKTKGPNGEQRPVDANSAAVLVGKIATRQVDEKPARRVSFKVVRE